MIVDGVEYLDEDLELFADGSVHDATLARDTLIQEVPCRGGMSVVFFPSGRLRLAYLSRAARVDGILCRAEIVYLHPNGKLLNGTLSRGRKFGGVRVGGGERVTLNAKGDLLEYTEGLKEDREVDGLFCAAEYRVWRYANGRLSKVVLAKAAKVKGRRYGRGAELFFGDDGDVVEVYTMDLDSGQRYRERVFGVWEAKYT